MAKVYITKYAISRGIEEIEREIASLRKQIEKLEKMTF
jgi:hypothetical protein